MGNPETQRHKPTILGSFTSPIYGYFWERHLFTVETIRTWCTIETGTHHWNFQFPTLKRKNDRHFPIEKGNEAGWIGIPCKKTESYRCMQQTSGIPLRWTNMPGTTNIQSRISSANRGCSITWLNTITVLNHQSEVQVFWVLNMGLVGGFNPSEKYEFVQFKLIIPNWMGKNMIQNTNQGYMMLCVQGEVTFPKHQTERSQGTPTGHTYRAPRAPKGHEPADVWHIFGWISSTNCGVKPIPPFFHHHWIASLVVYGRFISWMPWYIYTIWLVVQ